MRGHKKNKLRLEQIHPRLQHVRRKRRRSHLRRWAGLVLMLLLGLGGWISYPYFREWLSQQSYFNITGITFSGLERVSESEISALLPPLKGKNLFSLDMPWLEKQLEQHSWVEKADLHRHLPAGLLIEIHERQPVALVNCGDLWAIDRSGVILPLEGERGEIDLPIINAGIGPELKAGVATSDLRVLVLLPQIAALQKRLPEIWGAISEVSWDEKGQIEIYVFRNSARVLLGEKPTWQQMLNFYTFLIYQGRRSGIEDITFVDLRFHEQVVVRRTTIQPDSIISKRI